VIRLLIVPSALEVARLVPDLRALPAGTELLACGVGLLRAGLTVAARLGRGGVRDALLVGLAGTRDARRAPVGALVIASAARNEACGAGHGEGFLGLSEIGMRGEPTDAELLPLSRPGGPVAGTAHGARVVVEGVLGSVAAASGSPDEAAAWRARHPDVLAEEMEAYAVALACAHAGVPVACVRAVCNVAGQRDVGAWDLQGSFDALRSALPALLAAPGPGLA
jgi:futalosine hydrolase